MTVHRIDKYDKEASYGLKCDCCGVCFWPEEKIFGQSFPEHIYKAKENGWVIAKQKEGFKHYCPDCESEYRKRKRDKYFVERLDREDT